MGCPSCGSYLAPANNLCGICQANVYRTQTLQMMQKQLIQKQMKMMKAQEKAAKAAMASQMMVPPMQYQQMGYQQMQCQPGYYQHPQMYQPQYPTYNYPTYNYPHRAEFHFFWFLCVGWWVVGSAVALVFPLGLLWFPWGRKLFVQALGYF